MRISGLTILVAGLVLRIAGPWFANQRPLGTALIIVGVVVIAVGWLLMLLVLSSNRRRW